MPAFAHDAVRGSAEPSSPAADGAGDACEIASVDAFFVIGIKCIDAGLILCSVSRAACRSVAKSSLVKESASSPGSCRYVHPAFEHGMLRRYDVQYLVVP